MSTLQEPLGSGFGAASTTADVIAGMNLSGKTAIVTGGYAGLGLETTRTLPSAGARVIVPARDHQKAVNALKGIDGVELEAMDCSIRRPLMPLRKSSSPLAGRYISS